MRSNISLYYLDLLPYLGGGFFILFFYLTLHKELYRTDIRDFSLCFLYIYVWYYTIYVL